jgi:hypothetical protein
MTAWDALLALAVFVGGATITWGIRTMAVGPAPDASRSQTTRRHAHAAQPPRPLLDRLPSRPLASLPVHRMVGTVRRVEDDRARPGELPRAQTKLTRQKVRHPPTGAGPFVHTSH